MDEIRLIPALDEAALRRAAEVHAVSWQDSHRSFCPPGFVAAHTPERQYRYLAEKAASGSRIFLLLREGENPIGVVTVTGDLIADLYILPEERNKGYGTVLLQYAMGQCAGSPTLWILENNDRARDFYLKAGFRETGNRQVITDRLDEIEFVLGVP